MQAKSETIRRLLDLEARGSVRVQALVQEPGSEFLAVDAEAAYWPAAETPEGPNGTEVPEGFTIRAERLRDEHYGGFAPVLQLPEQKTPVLLRLDELHRPVTKIVIDVQEVDHRQLIPVYIERPARSSCFVEINMAPNADARVLLVEVPDADESRPEGEEATEGSLPAVYCDLNLAEGARLEVAVVHDFRRYAVEDGVLRSAPAAQVTKSARPSTAIEDRPIYLYLSKVKKDARFKWLSVNLDESIHEYGHVRLVEPGAQGETYTAAFVPTDRIQHYQVIMEHEAPHTRSSVLSHGVVDETAEGRFVARGRIHKGANGTRCDQTSRFLTLDSSSRGFVDPLLVIDEFDVEAGHAGSSGQIDEAQLFYLRTRGIGREQAERLITQGFLKPLIDHLALDQARQLAHGILHSHGGGGGDAS